MPTIFTNMKWGEINLRYKIHLILTLRATSLEVERFSQMKLIKTLIISRLSIENFENRMTIKMLTASIDEFDPIHAIEHCNVAGIR